VFLLQVAFLLKERVFQPLDKVMRVWHFEKYSFEIKIYIGLMKKRVIEKNRLFEKTITF